MLNTSIHSTKTYKKEDELVGKEHRDATIRIENVYGDPCELFKNDNITIIRKNGKKMIVYIMANVSDIVNLVIGISRFAYIIQMIIAMYTQKLEV